MFPTLSAGALSISSFGIFLAIGFLFGVILVWRLSRAWDLNEEKVLDLMLLTFLGGFILSRIYFILVNFPSFGLDLSKWLNITKYPGFSFWGALLGGILALKFYSRKFRINFWQALDFAAVGLLGGLIFLDLGCFFASCNIGVSSKIFFALPMVGAIGQRIPIQLFEAGLYSLTLISLWKKTLHFHTQGTIFALSFIYIGLINLLSESFKQMHSNTLGFNVILIIFGVSIFYKLTKRKIASDIKALGTFLGQFIKDKDTRYAAMVRIKRNWYNYKVSIRWKLRLVTKLLRRLNVRFYHKESKYY